MLQLLLLCLPLSSSAVIYPLPVEQSAGVSGLLHCSGVPVVNAHLQLLDVDRSGTLSLPIDALSADSNDVMAEGLSDGGGRFSLQGSDIEMTPIEPVLSISYHNCGVCLLSTRVVAALS